MGADFLEHDGDIPGGLEAGGGWFRGWRLGVCRGGAKEDNQPHCFNLSRGMNQGRTPDPSRQIRAATVRERNAWGTSQTPRTRGCPGRGSDWVQNYSSPPGGGGGGGAGGALVRVPVPVFPVPVPVAVPVPVGLPWSPLLPGLIGPPLVPVLPGPLGRW